MISGTLLQHGGQERFLRDLNPGTFARQASGLTTAPPRSLFKHQMLGANALDQTYQTKVLENLSGKKDFKNLKNHANPIIIHQVSILYKPLLPTRNVQNYEKFEVSGPGQIFLVLKHKMVPFQTLLGVKWMHVFCIFAQKCGLLEETV